MMIVLAALSSLRLAAAVAAAGGPHAHAAPWTPGDAGRSACNAGFDHYPFCNSSLPLDDRVRDLIARIPDAAKLAMGAGVTQTPLSIFYHSVSIQNILSGV
jgi:hypothetical protein